ncbi:hypothetical protein GF318_04605 [Candidatus Micrarchaeota archaeon]|nr:hypothetical protein [Candidatus Micrarchaeota archaeon]
MELKRNSNKFGNNKTKRRLSGAVLTAGLLSSSCMVTPNQPVTLNQGRSDINLPEPDSQKNSHTDNAFSGFQDSRECSLVPEYHVSCELGPATVQVGEDGGEVVKFGGYLVHLLPEYPDDSEIRVRAHFLDRECHELEEPVLLALGERTHVRLPGALVSLSIVNLSEDQANVDVSLPYESGVLEAGQSMFVFTPKERYAVLLGDVLPGPANTAIIAVYDSEGQTVFSKNMTEGQNEMLQLGEYTLSLTVEGTFYEMESGTRIAKLRISNCD